MQIATLVLTATGPVWPSIWRRVKRFREHRLGSRAVVHGPGELDQTVEDRLATLDRLLEQGTITEDEYAKQRSRLLDEL
jgi:Short C-terminal domain